MTTSKARYAHHHGEPAVGRICGFDLLSNCSLRASRSNCGIRRASSSKRSISSAFLQRLRHALETSSLGCLQFAAARWCITFDSTPSDERSRQGFPRSGPPTWTALAPRAGSKKSICVDVSFAAIYTCERTREQLVSQAKLSKHNSTLKATS